MLCIISRVELGFDTDGFFMKSEFLRYNVSSLELGALDVFRSTVEVMLFDGVLTREEKRLIIKLASVLNLASDEPAYIYEAIQSNSETRPGTTIFEQDMRQIYTKVFEVAIVNASLSKDEFRVLAHLRSQFNIDDNVHADIEHELREMVKEKYDDKAVIDTLMDTLRDSVGLVGDLFDSFRKKTSEGDRP
jgi:arginyl-tRNA--protein-N-Asp/Glu arginylyltransferase